MKWWTLNVCFKMLSVCFHSILSTFCDGLNQHLLKIILNTCNNVSCIVCLFSINRPSLYMMRTSKVRSQISWEGVVTARCTCTPHGRTPLAGWSASAPSSWVSWLVSSTPASQQRHLMLVSVMGWKLSNKHYSICSTGNLFCYRPKWKFFFTCV